MEGKRKGVEKEREREGKKRVRKRLVRYVKMRIDRAIEMNASLFKSSEVRTTESRGRVSLSTSSSYSIIDLEHHLARSS